MNPWLSPKKTLPPTGKIVEVKLANGHVRKAVIFENEFNEEMWRTEDGKTAHFDNYSEAAMKGMSIIARGDIKAPVAWRRI